MKHILEYIKEALITEGGHSVEGVEPIKGNLAKPVADEVIKLVSDKFHCEMKALGSTGKKGADKTSGDIDIAIEYDWDKYEDVRKYVHEKVVDCKDGNVNNQLHVFNIGYPYKDGDETKFVQIDFMFTDDVEFADFAYHSPDFTKNESKYKGMYQSNLLMAIVSNTPLDKFEDMNTEYFTENDYDGKYVGKVKTFWKMYFDQNDGLKVEHKSFVGKTKPLANPTTIKQDKKILTKSIPEILHTCLGPNATKDTCSTFEKELAYITSDDYKYKSKQQLINIKKTFLDDWQFKLKTEPALIKEFEELFDKEIQNL